MSLDLIQRFHCKYSSSLDKKGTSFFNKKMLFTRKINFNLNTQSNFLNINFIKT